MTESSTGREPGAPTAPESLPYADSTTPHPLQTGGGGGVTRHDLATLALKLLGIYMLVQALAAAGSAGELLTYGVRGLPWTFVFFQIALVAFYGGIGWLLLLYGQRAAHRLLPEPLPGTAQPSATLSVTELQSAAFSVVALILVLVFALPGFIYDGWMYWGSNPADAAERMAQLKPDVARHVAELIFGVWLFYGSKRLAGYWRRIRARTAHGPDDGPL